MLPDPAQNEAARMDEAASSGKPPSQMNDMRGISLSVTMVLAVAMVLLFAVRNLRHERIRLLDGFAALQVASARAAASSMEDRLKNLAEDAHVIGALIERHTRGRDGAEAEQNMLASFATMANVVRHYRSLALLAADGHIRVSAVDPSEQPSVSNALLELSRATFGASGPAPKLRGPTEVVPGRYIYVYMFGVGSETVVITIDAPLFLRFRPLAGAKIVVTDPKGYEWIDCTAAHRCAPRGPDAHAAMERPSLGGGAGTTSLDASEAATLGLPGANAVVAWRTVDQPPMGSWRVSVVVSATPLSDQEHALARELFITAGGLLSAIGVIGALIVRQQRHAAALAERLRNAETLRSLEGQLIRAEKLSTTGVLAAGIAHEVGTPLGIIRARAELLLDEVPSEKGQRAVGTIIGQIDHISSTIREVLNFSRSQVVQLRSVSPELAIATATGLLAHRFQQQNIRVHVDVATGVPDVAADPNQLQQVLVNLIMNACDACSNGGQVWLSVRQLDQTSVLWQVRDNGSGIPEEHLLAVFDPFFTTKKRGEGTGLGLSVATSIVRNHGGDISLASVVGEGTTMTIRWPIAKEHSHVEG
jgi:signal transduction histidine kinase